MKTQISYSQLDGDQGVALVNGDIGDGEQAKQELANKLGLPAVAGQDQNTRLKNGGIDPASVKATHISE
ncbi:hypothetical protein [Bordetella genomosp. 13]|uniref:hypothetical protein n=1 Tax=Bordetella genomosp. 13 TaxID=463040 RepID=UPI0011A827EC|nr:hypothetical protein [Bordetella genomosp. 13]